MPTTDEKIDHLLQVLKERQHIVFIDHCEKKWGKADSSRTSTAC